MKIALDIDGTISEHPNFFAVLSSSFRAAGHQVLVLTYRDPERAALTEAELLQWGIEYDELVYSRSLQQKGELCAEHRVDLFIDDQDECIVDVPEHVVVLKVRNGGNFDFDRARWMSTSELTDLLR